MPFKLGGEKNVKRQTVTVATFLIIVFASVTIFAAVSIAQHPIALTEKSMASTQHNNLPLTPLFRPPPYRPPYIPTATPTPTSTPTPTPSG